MSRFDRLNSESDSQNGPWRRPRGPWRRAVALWKWLTRAWKRAIGAWRRAGRPRRSRALAWRRAPAPWRWRMGPWKTAGRGAEAARPARKRPEERSGRLVDGSGRLVGGSDRLAGPGGRLRRRGDEGGAARIEPGNAERGPRPMPERPSILAPGCRRAQPRSASSRARATCPLPRHWTRRRARRRRMGWRWRRAPRASRRGARATLGLPREVTRCGAGSARAAERSRVAAASPSMRHARLGCAVAMTSRSTASNPVGGTGLVLEHLLQLAADHGERDEARRGERLDDAAIVLREVPHPLGLRNR